MSGIAYSQYIWLSITFFLSYVLGSISTGYFIAQVVGAKNPQEHGSGSTGATNMLRLGGLWPALLTVLGDSLKGVLAILLTRILVPGSEVMVGFAALGVVLGHIFPFYLKFKGGKGVATFLAVQCALFWKVGLALYALWVVVALITRYSSVASLLSALAAPALVFFMTGDKSLAWLSLALFAILLATHQENITRLIACSEPKLDFKVS